jgi:aminoglycoside phosphotransferase (APT) family kinase protein
VRGDRLGAPRRRTALHLNLKTVRRIVRSLDPSLTAEGFRRLEGGSTEVYTIDVVGPNAKPLVLKVYPDEPLWGPAKEMLVASWLAELTPPVPRWLRVDESCTILPLRFALFTLLPGRSLRHWFGRPGIGEDYRQMGELLRRVHDVPMVAYGYIRGGGVETPRATNTECMVEAFDDVFRRFCDLGGDAGLGRRLEQLAVERFYLLAASSGPVLCHDDFHQGNVLALHDLDGGLRLRGLIDFGNARAGDSLFDLAKALFCSAHEDARSRQPLLEGYGPIDHPESERALWLYTLLHRMSMWCWLTKLERIASANGGPEGLLRDLGQMASAPEVG